MKSRPTYLKLTIGVLFLLTAFASKIQADPLTFSNVAAFQNGGATSINLLSNPNAALVGPSVTFRVDIAGVLSPGQTDTLSVVYTDANGANISQSFQIPLFGSVSPPFTLFFTITPPQVSFGGTPATLTLNLLNSSPDFVVPSTGQGVDSFTYTFTIAQPVPEPASMVLLFSGLSALGVYGGRYRSKTKEAEAPKRNRPQS